MKQNELDFTQIRLLKIPEIAKMLCISRAMAYRLVQTGEIRSVQIRSARRVLQEDLDDFITKNKSTYRNSR